ncbi:DUF6461 domain-containing protein [Streptomyces sp. NPDC004227]
MTYIAQPQHLSAWFASRGTPRHPRSGRLSDYSYESFIAGAFTVPGGGGEWTLVLHFDGGAAMQPRFLEALSAGGRAVVHSRNGGKPIHLARTSEAAGKGRSIGHRAIPKYQSLLWFLTGLETLALRSTQGSHTHSPAPGTVVRMRPATARRGGSNGRPTPGQRLLSHGLKTRVASASRRRKSVVERTISVGSASPLP